MTQSPKPQWYDRSFIYVLGVYGAVLISLMAAILVMGKLLSLPFQRAFLIVFGAFTIGGAYWKPWWYWEHRGGWLVRQAIGDRAARIVFMALGVVLLCLGIFADVSGSR